MSLKAGRVGVNPADVDPVTGHILASSSEGYTKAQADDKFLAKTDASSTYLSKSDASSTYESKSDASTAHNLLQPKTLSLPLELLTGTALTVESALLGLNTSKVDDTIVESAVTDIVEGASVDTGDMGNHLYKMGKIVHMALTLNAVTGSGGTKICEVPAGYRPKTQVHTRNTEGTHDIVIYPTGYVRIASSASSATLNIATSWVI